jgi:peptidoglycan/xylan/chitin deacetylase (PgdA/CDA1 family)
MSISAKLLRPLKSRLAPAIHGVLACEPILKIQRQRTSRKGVTVFMYHDVGSDRADIDAWQVIRASDFLRQVDYLRRHFDLVDLDQAMSHHEGRRATSSDRPLAVLTFDDGHRGNWEHLLPIVQREALPVTLYIATGHIESGRCYWFDRVVNSLQGSTVTALDLRSLGLGEYRFNETHGASNWALMQELLVAIKRSAPEQCDALADEVSRRLPARHDSILRPLNLSELAEVASCKWVTIGAHTHGHEVLTLLEPSKVRETILQSVSRLEQWLGRKPEHFAYPSGYFNAEVARQVEEIGLKTAATSQSGVWLRDQSRFVIPRVSVGRYDSFDKFKLFASGLLASA